MVEVSVQQQKPLKASGIFTTPNGKTIEIRDVWATNLESEMDNIRDIIEEYPYVAMVCNKVGFIHITFISNTSCLSKFKIGH